MKKAFQLILPVVLMGLFAMQAMALPAPVAKDCSPIQCCCNSGSSGDASANPSPGCATNILSITETAPMPCCRADQLPQETHIALHATPRPRSSQHGGLPALERRIADVTSFDGRPHFLFLNFLPTHSETPIYLNTLSIRC